MRTKRKRTNREQKGREEKQVQQQDWKESRGEGHTALLKLKKIKQRAGNSESDQHGIGIMKTEMTDSEEGRH